jgi:hypothetical protein
MKFLKIEVESFEVAKPKHEAYDWESRRKRASASPPDAKSATHAKICTKIRATMA